MSSECFVGEASRILNCSANHVRYLERTGQLRCRRVAGIRLFTRTEVVKLAEERYRKATGQAHWRVDAASQV